MGKRGRENERTRQQIERADHVLSMLEAISDGYDSVDEVEARAAITKPRDYDNEALRRGRSGEKNIGDLLKGTPGVSKVIHLKQNGDDDQAGRDIRIEGEIDGEPYAVFIQVKSSKDRARKFLQEKKKQLGVDDIRKWLLEQRLIVLYAFGNEEWTRNIFLRQVHEIQKFHSNCRENI